PHAPAETVRWTRSTPRRVRRNRHENRRIGRFHRLGGRHRGTAPVRDGDGGPTGAGGSVGRRLRHLDRVPVRTDGHTAPGRRWVHLQWTLAVLVRNRPL